VFCIDALPLVRSVALAVRLCSGGLVGAGWLLFAPWLAVGVADGFCFQSPGIIVLGTEFDVAFILFAYHRHTQTQASTHKGPRTLGQAINQPCRNAAALQTRPPAHLQPFAMLQNLASTQHTRSCFISCQTQPIDALSLA
jgi:hypothetical protein